MSTVEKNDQIEQVQIDYEIKKVRSLWQDAFRTFKKNKAGMVGLV